MATTINTISGIIYDSFNSPLTIVTVEAFDKDLRREQLLGQAVTDSNGHYTISYDPTKFADSELKNADIFIRVIAADGVALGQSAIYFNVTGNFVIDFKVGNIPIVELDEFDALVQIIRRLIESQSVAITDLQESDEFKDISFLAGETGEDATKIALLPLAFTLTGKTRIPPDIFYGLFRLKFPTDLNSLLLVKSDSIVNGIKEAISQNIISARWGNQKELDSIIQMFNQHASGAVLSGSDDKSAAFKQVIGAALPTPELQQTFVSVYLDNETKPEKFWEVLSQQPGFSDPKVIEGIQSVLQLNLLTNNISSLSTLLFNEQQQNPELKDLRGFSKFTFEDWHSRIKNLVSSGALVNFPEGITGDSPEEKSESFANSITSLVNSLYPASVFASRLNKDTSEAFKVTKADLTTFFANNPDFNLKTNSFNSSFDTSDHTGITDKTALKNELSSINRLYKITDDFGHVSALRLDAIDSATALVNKYNSARFAEKFASSMSAETAASVYKIAQKADNLSTVLAMSIRMRNDTSLNVINGPDNDASADYISMFGDINCGCEDCQSVYSPSAYLVDILNITRQYNQEALVKITDRRPDLVRILLTCKNTHTPLPYIDLVNELLENTIAPFPPVTINGEPAFPQFQTTNSPEELIAYPEHVDAAAYDILKTSNSAYNLPLDLPLEETRLYLDKLGVKRYGLMELFFGKNTESKYNDISIAADYLQLSQPDELNLINGTTSMPVNLAMVSDFLTDTGLSYIETLQLLECYFINPLAGGERTIKIVSTTQHQESCNIEDLKFQTTDPVSLKIKPFIRLWKKTGWDIFDLDRVFNALNITDYSGDVNRNLIVPLSHIARLKAKFKLSVQDIVTIWTKIDRHVYTDHSVDKQPAIPTQYEQLFQNKQVTNPIDPDFSNPDTLSGLMTSKSGIIIAALNLSQKDFDLLNQSPFTDGQLNLDNLSILYRYKMLSDALKMPVADLMNSSGLTSVNPFGNSSQTGDTISYIDAIAFIRSSGFSLPVLNNLLATDPDSSPKINKNDLSKVLSTLREGLMQIEQLEPVGATSQEQEENKRQNQNSFITDTLGTAFKTESRVIDVLINNLVKSAANNNDPAITPFIDHNFITSQGPLFTVDSSNVVTWIFPDVFNTYVLLLNTWDRISRLVSKLKISNDEFIYFQSNESKLNINGIWNLPASSSASDLYPAFRNLSNFIRLRDSLRAASANWYALFDYPIANGNNSKKLLIDSLVTQSNITLDTFEFLLGEAVNVTDTGFLKFNFPDDYLSGAVLLNIVNCADMAGQLGTNVENISKLIKPALDNVAAAIASSILKSKYDVPTWLSILTPLSNQLRVVKRNALISYILTSPDAAITTFRNENKLSDANSLYSYFLIDPEMDACMLTSRIKQAISSIQLFVDRCLMNLEGIALSSEFTIQWNIWRKRYRIWEANRKIFLYPENWIEPELRDDKSPFFRELESALKQNEITDETAEDAIRNYLEKLDTVANLEITGVYPDSLTGIVHVIGRTRSIPHKYYYTRQINSVWSAWEKIEIDIESDQILPTVWNNRLYLFWGILSEKDEKSEGFTVPSPGDNMLPDPKSLVVRLAWSEYKDGKWGAKNLSKDSVILNSFFRINQNNFSLSTFFDGEKLYIRIFYDLRADINNDFVWNFEGQAFEFDGCHSAPVIVQTNSGIEGIKLKFIQRIHNTRLDGVFLREDPGKDNFSVLDNGIYKDVFSPGGFAESMLLRNTPGMFRILPDHNEIEKIKPVTSFFFNNEQNNFYVHSSGGFIRPPLHDVSVLTEGFLANRKSISSIPTADLQLRPRLARFAGGITSTDFSSERRLVADSNFGRLTGLSTVFFGKHYSFQTFYHPFVCDLIKTLNTSGIEGLYKNLVTDSDNTLKDGIQNKAPREIFVPNGAYDPTSAVHKPYPVEKVDFDYSGMYSIYNWELFFHIPLLIATTLSKNQKFDEARKWFHYIFDPTKSPLSANSGVERFWITKPFKEEIFKGKMPIQDLINNASPDLNLQLDNWAQNPFNPHAVARLRVSAYMRSTVMKYIDNLIAWGDLLFQQNTLETINEATLLYILAANMLGKKPEEVPARAIPEENSFSTIDGKLDSFSNAKVAIESFISLSDLNTEITIDSVLMPLFCIPRNDILLGYWDIVADRLFKIRHCLNIQGIFQQLPLFEPPINPALLVKAAAAGLDLTSIMNTINAPLPNYRFQVILQKAIEICNDIRGLGSGLLTALEKKDAEQLTLLRSGHEINLLKAVRDIKVSQVDESKALLDGLNRSKDVIQAKRDYYSGRDFINIYEAVYFTSIPVAMVFQHMQIGAQALAAISYALPQVTIGPFSSGATHGGENIGHAQTSAAAGFNQIANLLNTIGIMANLYGNYVRRSEEWDYQKESADLELKQIDKQITAAEIRLAITEKDLENHDLQIEQTQDLNDFLNNKYTNEDLYNYMVGQISSVYFQSYQLAFNIAKKAEKCFQYELGIDNSSFINFGYWDSLKKGLLSGEKLQFDLRRLESEYMDRNIREYEIVKHVSLIQLNPLALIKLRSTGSCDFDIPEVLYDMDYAGHYFRRIKSVSISLPCIAGPYTSVSAHLSLITSKYRKNTDISNGYAEDTGNDPRFNSNAGTIQSIATSSAQNDSGVFELNFRDERYLPFEGKGAISSWRLELPSEVAQFDYNTIADVIIHMKYTSREGGSGIKDAANETLRDQLNSIKQMLGETGLHIALDLKHDLPNEWHLLKKNGFVDLVIDKLRLPYMAQSLTAELEHILFIAKVKGNPSVVPLLVNNNPIELSKIEEWNLYQGPDSSIDLNIELNTTFRVSIPPSLDSKDLDDLLLIVKYNF